MATAHDVAAQANVSVGTVSRYFTGNGYVSAGARERIAAAVTELGYIPNRAAASLTTKKTGLLGFVVSDLRNPFAAEVAAALGRGAQEHGYCLVLADSMDDADQSAAAIELLRSHDVDGLIVTPPESPVLDEVLRAAAQTIPVVGIGLRTTPMTTDLVTADTGSGARQAMDYLFGLGHRRIAFIGSATQASGRYRAYRDALTARGVVLDPLLVRVGELNRAAGYDAVTSLMGIDEPPTAVFAVNDAVALGAIQAARDLRVPVPEQLSVVGFDDVDLAAHCVPPLTTVAQPMAALGEAAIQLLMRRFAGGTAAEGPRQVVLDCTLVVRESCSQPATR